MSDYHNIEFILKELLKRGADECDIVIGNSKFTATICVSIKEIEFKKADAEA